MTGSHKEMLTVLVSRGGGLLRDACVWNATRPSSGLKTQLIAHQNQQGGWWSGAGSVGASRACQWKDSRPYYSEWKSIGSCCFDPRRRCLHTNERFTLCSHGAGAERYHRFSFAQPARPPASSGAIHKDGAGWGRWSAYSTS